MIDREPKSVSWVIVHSPPNRILSNDYNAFCESMEPETGGGFRKHLILITYLKRLGW